MNICKNLLFFLIIFLLSSICSYSQNTRIPAQKRMQMHHEKKEDNYVPNAYANQRTSPGIKYRIKGGSGAKVMTSGIFTTQVNVNSGGQNIVGDAANETSIALNPVNGGEIAIGWRQFDNVTSNFRQAGWAYSSDSGQTWTFPGVIEPGIFRSDPVLDFDRLGNFYYNSLTNNPDYFCKVFKSTNGGATWNTGTDAQGGDKQWMTIDRTLGTGSGNIYSTWTSFYSTCPPGFFTRSANGNASYENCTVVDGDPYWSNMTVGNSGELYIGAGSGFSDSLVVVKSLNAQIPGSIITWNAVTIYMDGYLNGWTSVNPAGIMGQVNIDVDRSGGPGNGNVYVLASMTRFSNGDQGDVMFAKSTDGGLTWSAPVRINDDPTPNNTQWFGTMSVAPNGRIDAVWLDTRNDITGGDNSALYYSYSIDQGDTWSPNEMMSATFDPHVGYPNQDKMGDYFDMVSDNNGAHLAWANTLNGEQDAYYSYITPPVTTGTPDLSAQFIKVYPNPSTGIFKVETDDKALYLELYNMIGEKIFSSFISRNQTEIDISIQSSGIYQLKVVKRDGSNVVKKIIKN
jgi:hypothetical protein